MRLGQHLPHWWKFVKNHSKICKSIIVLDMYIISPMQDMLPKSHEYVVMTSRLPPPLPPKHVKGHISYMAKLPIPIPRLVKGRPHTFENIGFQMENSGAKGY